MLMIGLIELLENSDTNDLLKETLERSNEDDPFLRRTQKIMIEQDNDIYENILCDLILMTKHSSHLHEFTTLIRNRWSVQCLWSACVFFQTEEAFKTK